MTNEDVRSHSKPVLPSSIIYPVILSGGSGSRLWPLSRPSRPKQFLPLITSMSMMQDTLARTTQKHGFGAPIVVSNKDHGDLILEQTGSLEADPAAIFLEPEGRNTSAAIALPAYWLSARTPDALMLIMPSDHVIADLPAFHQAIAKAVPAAEQGYLVTFGIQPHRPETGYGYIESGDVLAGLAGVHTLLSFVEKPKIDAARAYVAGGRHYWNGGIFLFSARAYIEQLEALAPEVASASAAAIAGAVTEGRFLIHPDAAAFKKAPDVSIDYAVMEKTTKAAVVPVDMGWSDVGSWDALWAVRAQDSASNSVKGPAITIDCTGNLVYIDGGPPVAAVGMTDTVIVSTEGGVLVMPRDRAQDVKVVVEHLKREGFITT